MNAIVDPAGPELCVLPTNPVPEGARAGWFVTSDNVRLRYATFAKGSGPQRGTVCLVQGRTEFIEKYFETIADFQSRGFAVATFDWRGQGGSQRLIGNKKLGYVERFEDYWVDLQSFHREILLPDCPPPFYLVGHSMGGLVSLFAGTKDRMMFDRMLVSAPMVALDRQPLSMGGMAQVGDVLNFFGLGQAPVGRREDRSLTEASFPDQRRDLRPAALHAHGRHLSCPPRPRDRLAHRALVRGRVPRDGGSGDRPLPRRHQDSGPDAGSGARHRGFVGCDRASRPPHADGQARRDRRAPSTSSSWKTTSFAPRSSPPSTRSSPSSRHRGRWQPRAAVTTS